MMLKGGIDRNTDRNNRSSAKKERDETEETVMG
jgi:hypothetical protein